MMARRLRGTAVALLLLEFAQISSLYSSDVDAPTRLSLLGLNSSATGSKCGPFVLSNGQARPSGAVPYWSTVRLSCAPGYRLDGRGNPTVRCLGNNNYTEGKTCRPVSCGRLAVAGGIADPPGEIFYRDTVKLACGRGYRLSAGSAHRRCLSSSHFSDGALCEPSESWAGANVQHARADLLTERAILIAGHNFMSGAFYQCHLASARNSGSRTLLSTEVIFPSAFFHSMSTWY
jgi:hypothetical protein